MGIRRSLIAAAPLLIIAGCSQRADHDADPLSATSSTTPLTYYEQEIREAQPVHLPTPYHAYVDYESRIFVKPDPKALRELADRQTGASPVPTISIGELKSLRLAMAEVLDDLAAANQETAQALRNFIQTPTEPTIRDQLDHALQRKSQQVATLERALVKYLAFRHLDGLFSDKNRIGDLLEASGAREAEQRLVTGKTEMLKSLADGYAVMCFAGDTIDHNGFARFLQEYAAWLDSLAEQPLGPTSSLMMDAYLVRGGKTTQHLPISVSPYTIVPGITGTGKSRRIRLQPSESEQQQLDAQRELSENFADRLNLILHHQQDAPRYMRAILQRALDQIGEQLQTWLQTVPAEVQDASTYPRLAATITSIRQMMGESRMIADQLRRIDQTSFAGLVGLAEEMRTLARRVKSFAEQIRNATDIAQELTALVQAKGDHADAWFRTALTETMKTVSASCGLSDELLTKASAQQELAKIDPSRIRRVAVPINRPEPGVIYLADTPAEPLDQVRIGIRLQHPAAATGTGPGSTHEEDVEQQVFEIRKFGFHTTFGAHVLLVDRLSDDDDTFVFAAATSVNLHYRGRSAEWFQEWVSPGIGVSVAGLNFVGSTELGLGAQITMLQDFVQVGVGRNVSVGEDPYYWYVGLDLVKPVTQLYQVSTGK